MSEIWKAPPDTAIVIVDVQNDFCPGGNLAVAGGDEIVPLVNELKKHFNLAVLTQDWHPEGHKSFASAHKGKTPMQTIEMPYGTQVLWPDHCVQDSEGAAFRDDLDVAPGDLVLRKGTHADIDSYSGFFENDHKTQPRFEDGRTLSETLRDAGIKNIVFVGLAYDFCVGWHALDAISEGFNAIVVKDATRAIAVPDPNGGPDTEQGMSAQFQRAGVKIVSATNLYRVLRPGN